MKTADSRRPTAGRYLSTGFRQLPVVVVVVSLIAAGLTACEAATRAAPLPFPTLAAPLLPTRTPPPTLTPTSTTTPELTPTPLSTVAPITADGWQIVRAGIFLREMAADPQTKAGRVYVVKIDPAQVDFHVLYQPAAPLHVREWYSNTQALIVINSSFFDQANHAVGQLTTAGKRDGQSHDRMEGAFYLTAAGAAVWPLRGWVKPAGLQIFESVESFPMLLMPGGLLNAEIANDPRAARRTVVAVDRSGNVLFIVTPDSAFTLHGMAVWLANSDLDIDTALNFDGGSSSGLAVWTPTGAWGFDSANKVPAVVTADVKVLGTTGPGDGEWP